MDAATPICKAHYPLLLDGEEVRCSLAGGHPGNHIEHGRDGLREFADQPECWS